MLESFLIVGNKILVLFILIALGYWGAKKDLITEEGTRTITNIMLYIVTPCVIVNAFQKEFNWELFHGFVISFVAAIASHIVGIILSKICIRNKDDMKNRLYQAGVVFSNCGFMAFPLLEALLGEEGVFYGASYIAVFNIVLWSYGIILMDKETPKLDIKKIIFNPGILPVVIGLVFFFVSFSLPGIIKTPVDYLCSLNTPVPMLVIGYYAAQIKFNEILRDKDELIMHMLKLVIVPLVVLGLLYAFGVRGTILVACIVSAASPTATSCTMFSIKFGLDAKLSSQTVAVSTLFSIVTLTLIVGLARFIA